VEHLWTPWRLAYVTGGTAPGGCVFCRAAAPSDQPASDDACDPLIVHDGIHAFVILNLYPYNNGHIMVVPRRHLATLTAATADELAELMALTRDAEQVLTDAYAPHGINVGINLGRAAGAGVADHLHIHLVPRWNGDTNFMTVVADSRVLPETLEQTAARLRPLFARLHG
jgi:ATP adenylyltransferase